MHVDTCNKIGIDKYGCWWMFTVNGVSFRMRSIPAGTFLMGSPEGEPERNGDEEQHEVTISKFWLAETACTQELWQAVMGDNPSMFKGGGLPVEQVSWDDCQRFLDAINRMLPLPGNGFRLPTEAEWEHACRAGTSTPFSFGQNITPDEVNYDGNYPYADGEKGEYRRLTVPAGSLPCNAWGLHEMHGNVWEWCADWCGKYPGGAVIDPRGPDRGAHRVLRGGSWFNYARNCRSAYRSYYVPGYRNGSVGFRFARGEKGDSQSMRCVICGKTAFARSPEMVKYGKSHYDCESGGHSFYPRAVQQENRTPGGEQ